MQAMLDLGYNQFSVSPIGSSVVRRTLLGLSDQEIFKALATEGSVGSNASVMIGQSLDPLVKSLLLDPNQFGVLLKRLEIYKAKAVSEQYNRLTKYGLAEYSSRREGALGPEDAEKYEQVSRSVRFFGRRFGVTTTLQYAAAPKFGDQKARTTMIQTNKFLLDLNRDILWGHSTLQPLQWQGLFQQMAALGSRYETDLAVLGSAAGRVTKVSGGALTLDTVRSKAVNALRTNGHPTALYCSPAEQLAFGIAQNQNQHYYAQDLNSPIAPGLRVSGIRTDFGKVIEVVWDYFLTHERGKMSLYPEDPSVAANFHEEAGPRLASGAFSLGVAADGELPVGTYYYGIACVSDVAEGPIRLLSTGQATTNANGKVEITVTHPSDTAKINAYRVYRSKVNGTDYEQMVFLKEVEIDTANPTQVIVDDGSLIPGARRALTIDETASAIGFLEYPTIRDLPMNDEVHRSAINAQGVCQLYIPERGHAFKNAGTDAVA